jgi:hypothetical protein
LRVVALVGSLSKAVFEHLIHNAPNIRIYALIGNADMPKSLGKVSGLLVLSREEIAKVKSRRFNPKEFFPYLKDGDFLLMLGISEGLFPVVLATNEKESLFDTSLILARVGEKGPEEVEEVALNELWGFLVKKVPEYPALLDCGLCGFKTCEEYLRGAISGEDVRCLSSHTFLMVDGEIVKMNPFIIKQLRALTKAYLSTLKGIRTEEIREIHMKLDLQ